MSKSIKLNVPNQEDLELPVLEASIGHDVVDIRALTKTQAYSHSTRVRFNSKLRIKITYIDGDKGLLAITVVIPSNNLPKNPIIWKSATC